MVNVVTSGLLLEAVQKSHYSFMRKNRTLS